jgi:hypothetical protein
MFALSPAYLHFVGDDLQTGRVLVRSEQLLVDRTDEACPKFVKAKVQKRPGNLV